MGDIKKTINMMSKADSVEGQGVLSATIEQIRLVKDGLSDNFQVIENSSKKSDIIHYHTINPEYYLTLPFKKKTSKVICSVHFLPETLENSIRLPKYLKLAFYKYVISFYKKMDYLVTVNPYFIEKLTNYGIDRKKIFYIPNFVSNEYFYRIEDKTKEELRKKYKLDKDKFIVLSVGQLQTRKGIFDFLKIAQSMPDVYFLWAGGFSFSKISDGYERIKKIVKNPPENVKFLGIVKRNQMNEIYNLSDVMLLASYEELFPMAILESMSCNLPIILRDLEIYKNIFFDFYLKHNNNDGFIDIINTLKTNTSEYNKALEMSKKGNTLYSKEHVLDIWENFYKDISYEKQ